MKSILISIKPKYVADILNHKKTIEVRKSMPKCDLPIDVYIYCTKDTKHFLIKPNELHIPCPYIWLSGGIKDDINYNGKVIAKFTLNKVEEFTNDELWERLFKTDLLIHKSCVSFPQLMVYSRASSIYAWHIDNLVIFDKPKELSEFIQSKRKNYEEPQVQKAPQSWCYVEVE